MFEDRRVWWLYMGNLLLPNAFLFIYGCMRHQTSPNQNCDFVLKTRDTWMYCIIAYSCRFNQLDNSISFGICDGFIPGYHRLRLAMSRLHGILYHAWQKMVHGKSFALVTGPNSMAWKLSCSFLVPDPLLNPRALIFGGPQMTDWSTKAHWWMTAESSKPTFSVWGLS